MPSKILGRLLRPLDQVYRFVGAQKGAPEEFELDLPIQPVHDLSSMAAFRSASWPINDGLLNFTTRLVHAGASTLSTTPSPWSGSVANGFPTDRGGNYPEICWWIYRTWVTASNAGFTRAIAMVIHGSATVGISSGVGASAKAEPVFFGDGGTPAGIATDYVVLSDSDDFINNVPFPIRVMDNPSGLIDSYMWVQSTSTGVVNMDFNTKIWMGPSGVRPPQV